MNRHDLRKTYRLSNYFLTISFLFLTSISCLALESSTEIPVEGVAFTYQPVPTNMPELLAVEGNAEIKFPPSAHEIYAYTTGIQDIDIRVRFSMNASELSEFMNNTICNQPLEKTEAIQNLSDNNSDWWIPEKAEYSEECYGEKEFSHQHIIIDMSDQEVYIVYVSTSTN
jgi:hypothetical protein